MKDHEKVIRSQLEKFVVTGGSVNELTIAQYIFLKIEFVYV